MRRSPRRWTAQEDVVLLEKAKQQIDSPTGISWGSVSNAIPNRNNKDCRKRWYKLTGTKKGFWTASEDERLMEGVQKYGSQWVRVAEVVGPGTRNPDQCAKRWQQCLDPSLDRSEWTQEQDVLLLSAVTDHGTNWKIIKGLVFPNRSTTNLKNRHIALLRQSNKNPDICPNSPLEPDCTQDIFDNTSIGDNSPIFQNTFDYNPAVFNQPPLSWDFPFPTEFAPFDNFPGYDPNTFTEPTFSPDHLNNMEVNSELFLPDVAMGSPSHPETDEHKEANRMSFSLPQTILVLENPDSQTMTSILEILVKAKIKVTVSSTQV